MSASIYFSNCVLFARFHFSRSPTLYGISFMFLKNAGGAFKMYDCLFEKVQDNEKQM